MASDFKVKVEEGAQKIFLKCPINIFNWDFGEDLNLRTHG